MESRKLFKHSGASGDMVYGLAAMKKMGGGSFEIYDPRNGHCIHDNMMPLIEVQEYFHKHESVDEIVDLDKFREFQPEAPILLRHFRSFGLEEEGCYEPWLTLPEFPKVLGKAIVINCTERYNPQNFGQKEWGILIDELLLNNHLIFVGAREEHVGVFEKIIYHPTTNALEVAAIVKHADTVICNESMVLAIARGLGHKDIRLVCADGYDHQLLHTPNETYLNR